MAIIAIPKILREKLSDEGADALVELVNKADERQKEDALKFVGEKFEVRLSSFEERIDAKLTVLEEKFERRLAEEIGKVRAEIIKWMLIFIFGQFWAIVGVLFAFFRK
jgi:glutamine synthetase type III